MPETINSPAVNLAERMKPANKKIAEADKRPPSARHFKRKQTALHFNEAVSVLSAVGREQTDAPDKSAAIRLTTAALADWKRSCTAIRNAMRNANRKIKRLQKAEAAGLMLAADSLRPVAVRYVDMAKDTARAFSNAKSPEWPGVTPGGNRKTELKSNEKILDMVAELQMAREEFGGLCIEKSSGETRLSVKTGPIHLEHEGHELHLGRFKITIRLSPKNMSTDSIRCEALEPNRAADADYTHPHVDGGRLCTGEAGAPLQNALNQRRFGDVFILVRSVLNEYNPDSPYREIEHWHDEQDEAESCGDCGGEVHSDDSYTCYRCDRLRCDNCIHHCDECGNYYCEHCIYYDSVAEQHVCGNCRNECKNCGRTTVSGDFNDDLMLCSGCEKEAAQKAEAAEAAKAEETANTPQQSDRLTPTTETTHVTGDTDDGRDDDYYDDGADDTRTGFLPDSVSETGADEAGHHTGTGGGEPGRNQAAGQTGGTGFSGQNVLDVFLGRQDLIDGVIGQSGGDISIIDVILAVVRAGAEGAYLPRPGLDEAPVLPPQG